MRKKGAGACSSFGRADGVRALSSLYPKSKSRWVPSSVANNAAHRIRLCIGRNLQNQQEKSLVGSH